MKKIVEKGFIDPLSLIGVAFLVVTLITATAVTTNPDLTQKFRGKASAPLCQGFCVTSPDECDTGAVTGTNCKSPKSYCCGIAYTPVPTPTTIPSTPSCRQTGCLAPGEDCCGDNYSDTSCQPTETRCGTKPATPIPTPIPSLKCFCEDFSCRVNCRMATSGTNQCSLNYCTGESFDCTSAGLTNGESKCISTTQISICSSGTLVTKNCTSGTSCTIGDTTCKPVSVRFPTPTATPSCRQTGCLAPGEDCCGDSYTDTMCQPTETRCGTKPATPIPTPVPNLKCFCEDFTCRVNCRMATSGTNQCSLNYCTGESFDCTSAGLTNGESKCLSTTQIQTCVSGNLTTSNCSAGTACSGIPPICKDLGTYMSSACFGKCSVTESCVSVGMGYYTCKDKSEIEAVGTKRCSADGKKLETFNGSSWDWLYCENGCDSTKFECKSMLSLDYSFFEGADKQTLYAPHLIMDFSLLVQNVHQVQNVIRAIV